MGVGIKIKRLREDKKISQPELAELLGISQSTLSNIESEASKKIDFMMMDKVCRIFDKEFDYFVEEKTVNNVEKNNGGVVGYNHGTINFFPEDVIEQIKQLVEANKVKDTKIEELTKQIQELKNQK